MKTLVEELEEGMRQGKGAEVRARLQRLSPKAVKNADLAKLAQLSWRAGLPELGLKILHPLIRPKARKPATASSAQKAEYAACLIRLEAHEEASLILSDLSPKDLPQVWLYRALTKIGKWDYEKSIPFIRAYLKSDLAPYQRLVGQVNLASALIHERRHAEAKPLLRELTHESSLRGLNLLLANSLELSAANFIHQGQGKQAQPFLDRAEKLLKEHGNVDAFYVFKWRGLIAFQKEKTLDKAKGHLEKIRAAALSGGHWESLRDCDRFEALRTRTPDLIHKLYFGTPYASYRARLLADLDWKSPLPESFAWVMKEGKSAGASFDFLFGSPSLKPGQAIFRLALSLASDFYRPHRLGPLFSQLFPDEYFNPHSSAHRVHELVRRLRVWLVAKRVPLVIVERDGAYRLEGKKPCAILVPLVSSRVARWRLTLDELRSHFVEGGFGVAEASRYLGISSMSLLRLLGEALREKAIAREGRGKATRYRIASNF